MHKNPFDTRPEYEIAHENASILFSELGITCETSKPYAMVRDDWPCIAYDLTFIRGTRKIKTEYHLGIGHVKGKIPNYIDKMRQAQEASVLAIQQKVTPLPSEVLARICSEGLEAIQQDFEEWASNFGYDTDSMKAKKTYDACIESYQKALKILTCEQIKTFAEYASQF